MGKKIRVTQTRNGKRVTFLTPDKGKPGKTPKAEQWYEPGVETGWKKDMPEGERRRLVLQAHKGDELSSARSMQAKANVTTDRETEQRARADAQYFFREHRMRKRPVTIKPRVKKVVKEKVPAVPETVVPEAVSEAKALTEDVWRISPVEDRASWAKLAGLEGKIGSKAWADLTTGEKDAIRLAREEIAPTLPEAKPPAVEEVKPRLGNLQRIHARRSTQAQVRDEQQRHQVTVEPDSPKVKQWIKDPSAADIKGIDTPGARTLRRKGAPRITPKTPRLRR